MSGLRLPTEVCERVIDYIPYYTDPDGFTHTKKSRDTLSACSLVCKSWVPRCQLHLFARVELTNSLQAKSFLGILARSPSVGQGVLGLVISPSPPSTEQASKIPPCYYNWIYKTLTTLPSLLTKLYQLVFQRLPTLHPTFILLASQFKTVRCLILNDLVDQSFREIIRLVNRLPRLQELQLRWCRWRQPAHFYASKQLESLDIQAGDDCRRDAIKWMSSSRCSSSLNSLVFSSIDTILIIELDRVLQQCTATLRYLHVYFAQGILRTAGKLSTTSLDLVQMAFSL